MTTSGFIRMVELEAQNQASESDELSHAVLVPEPPTNADSTDQGDEPKVSGKQSLDGQPRDDHGRFKTHADDTAQAPTDGSPQEAVDAEAVSNVETPPDSSDAGADVPAIPPELAEKLTREAKPFSFRANGQVHGLEGAEEYPDGSVFIPANLAPQLKQDMSNALHYRTVWRQQLDQAKSEGRQQVEALTAQAKATEAVAMRLLDVLDDPQELARVASDPREAALLKRMLALTFKESAPQQMSAPQPNYSLNQGQQAAPQPGQVEALQAQAQSTLEDEVLTALAHDPKYAVLARDNETQKEVVETFLMTLPSYFAERDGQVMLDRFAVKNMLDREVKRVQAVYDAKGSSERMARELKAAAEKNALKAQPAPRIPGAVPTRGSAPPGEKKSSGFSTAEEWKRSMGID